MSPKPASQNQSVARSAQTDATRPSTFELSVLASIIATQLRTPAHGNFEAAEMIYRAARAYLYQDSAEQEAYQAGLQVIIRGMKDVAPVDPKAQPFPEIELELSYLLPGTGEDEDKTVRDIPTARAITSWRGVKKAISRLGANGFLPLEEFLLDSLQKDKGMTRADVGSINEARVVELACRVCRRAKAKNGFVTYPEPLSGDSKSLSLSRFLAREKPTGTPEPKSRTTDPKRSRLRKKRARK
jgi:hypothetical protein